MKTIVKLITITLTILLVACSRFNQGPENNDITIHGSGNLVSKEIDVNDIDQLEAGLHFSLAIRQGEETSVRLTSDDNFIDFIQIDQVESTLVFGLDPAYAYNFYNVTLQVEVTLPDLAGLTLNGSSQAVLLDARSLSEFGAELSGSSWLTGTLQANAASFELSGSTSVELGGSAVQLRLNACGNSIANLERFAVENAALEVSCNSQTSVAVNGRLDIDASQHAQIFYFGEPERVNSALFENAFVEQK